MHLPRVDFGFRRRSAALRDALRDARKLAEGDVPLQDARTAGVALALRSMLGSEIVSESCLCQRLSSIQREFLQDKPNAAVLLPCAIAES